MNGAVERILGSAAIGTVAAALTRESSPLGPVEQWSSALVSTLDWMLLSSAEIVLFWGPQFCAVYNGAYAPTIGTKHPEAFGRPASEGWRELWDDLGPLLTQVRSSGERIHAKDRAFYIERQDGGGEEVFFDISYSPVFDGDGTIGGVLCIVSETTARVVGQREALADRNRLWNIARDPFLVADRNGVWQNASPAWSEILGWETADLVGRTSEWLEHPDDRDKTRLEVSELAQGRSTLRFENRFRASDGSYRWFSWTAVPEGELLYCVARDVTAERENAEALRIAEESLRQAQKMETIGHLTGGIAHDFNNLLQVISGNLELVQRADLASEPRIERAAANALTATRRAAELTQRLLAFSRRQPLMPQRVDPDQLIASIHDLLTRTLGETIAMKIAGDSDGWGIEVDSNQLENTLLNLAVNARDAMPRGGGLTITTGRHHEPSPGCQGDDLAPGDYVAIRIADTGEGMSANVLRQAFEPFFTTKEVGRGTGLGLSMVYGFITQSGGTVRLRSEVGQGTTVELLLPRSTRPEAPPEADKPVESLPRGNGETILVCEDDEGVRHYAVEVLEDLGYRVIEAADASSALCRFDGQDRLDLLVTDVILGGEANGAELATEVGRRFPDARVLFISGYPRDVIMHQGRVDPGVELLVKPFSSTELAVRVAALLGRSGASAA